MVSLIDQLFAVVTEDNHLANDRFTVRGEQYCRPAHRNSGNQVTEDLRIQIASPLPITDVGCGIRSRNSAKFASVALMSGAIEAFEESEADEFMSAFGQWK